MGPSVGYTPFNLRFFIAHSVLILILKAWNNRPVFSNRLQHRASFLTPPLSLSLGYPQKLSCEHRFKLLLCTITVAPPEAFDEQIIPSTRLKRACVLNNQIDYKRWSDLIQFEVCVKLLSHSTGSFIYCSMYGF